MDVKFASHCSYQIRYHQVYCVKYRKKLLQDSTIVNELKKILYEISEHYWFEIDEIWTDWDHMHIFIWWAPKHAPSQIMQIVKSITARELYKRLPELKKKLRWWQFRSDGWYIGTVWEWTNESIVKRYIRHQWSPTEKEWLKQLQLFKL